MSAFVNVTLKTEIIDQTVKKTIYLTKKDAERDVLYRTFLKTLDYLLP